MEQQPNRSEARTTIDSMLELIRSKGRMDLNTIAGALNIAPSVVEGWAKVLESGGLVKISYEVGKMFVSPLEMSKDELKAVETKTEQQKFILEEQVDAEVIGLDKLQDSLKTLSSNIAQSEQALSKASPEAQKKVSELTKLYSEVRSYDNNINKIKGAVASDYDSMEKRYNGVLDKIKKVSEEEQKIRAEGSGSAPEIVAGVKSALQELTVLKANVNSSIDELKKNLEEQIKQENTRLEIIIKQAQAQLDSQEKLFQHSAAELRDITKELQDLHNQEEQMSKKVNQAHSEYSNNFAKFHDLINKTEQSFSPKYEEVLAKLNQSIGNFGDFGDIMKEIAELKSSIAETEPKINSYKEELQKIKDQLAALSAQKNLDMKAAEEKAKALDSQNEKIKDDIKVSTDEISNSIKKIKGKLGNKNKPGNGQGVSDK